MNRASTSPSIVRGIVLASSLLITILGLLAFVIAMIGFGSPPALTIAASVPFAILFGWISFSFLLTCVGLTDVGLSDRTGGSERTSRSAFDDSRPRSRTAILMPIYNESPDRVFAAVAAMRQDLEAFASAAGWRARDCFDIYVLSDTTDPEIWLREEWCWSVLVDRAPQASAADASVPVFYRHRTDNTSRKAGNIADFCENWGGSYECMLILDADSLMTATTMIEMVHRMEADPDLAILQVPPVPIGRTSVFARWQQFAAAVYGPLFASGYAAWSGDQGNYWGHNAILRIAPFKAHCALPVLPGKKPLGGEVLSHDFVEAAFLVRAGWKVRLALDLGGSFEECPTTINDFVRRDQRWCQGNLQHWRLMLADAMHPISRGHFCIGILSYASAPLWLLFIGVTLIAMLASSADASGASPWLAFSLFAVSMAMLLLPKVFAIAQVLADPKRRRDLGGTFRPVAGTALETATSVLVAPIIAVYHSRFVIAVLSGRGVSWNAQQRGEHGVTWTEAFAEHRELTFLGVLSGIGLAWVDGTTCLWFAPIWIGWSASIPLAVLMGSQRWGHRLARWGVWTIASERHAEPIVAARRAWLKRLAVTSQTLHAESMFDRLLNDPSVRGLHRDILSATESANPIDAEVEKQVELASNDGDLSRLSPQARRRLLSDDHSIEALATSIGQNASPLSDRCR